MANYLLIDDVGGPLGRLGLVEEAGLAARDESDHVGVRCQSGKCLCFIIVLLHGALDSGRVRHVPHFGNYLLTERVSGVVDV